MELLHVMELPPHVKAGGGDNEVHELTFARETCQASSGQPAKIASSSLKPAIWVASDDNQFLYRGMHRRYIGEIDFYNPSR